MIKIRGGSVRLQRQDYNDMMQQPTDGSIATVHLSVSLSVGTLKYEFESESINWPFGLRMRRRSVLFVACARKNRQETFSSVKNRSFRFSAGSLRQTLHIYPSVDYVRTYVGIDAQCVSRSGSARTYSVNETVFFTN